MPQLFMIIHENYENMFGLVVIWLGRRSFAHVLLMTLVAGIFFLRVFGITIFVLFQTRISL